MSGIPVEEFLRLSEVSTGLKLKYINCHECGQEILILKRPDRYIRCRKCHTTYRANRNYKEVHGVSTNVKGILMQVSVK